MKIPWSRILYSALKNKIGISTPMVWNHQITYKCQAECGFCRFNSKFKYWKNFDEEMKTEDIQNMAAQIYDLGAIVSSFEGGEPTIRPDLPVILKYCKKLGFYVHVVTNGGFLNRHAPLISPHCDALSVSLDYPDERHSKERGVGIFSQAVEGIKEANKHTIVTINTIIHKDNINDLEEMIEFTQQVGARGISFVPVETTGNLGRDFSIEDKKKFVDVINKLKKLKREGAPILNSQKYFDVVLGGKWKCYTPSLQINTDPFGNIRSPCGIWSDRLGSCYDMNTRDKEITKIWYSKEAKRTRKLASNCTACHLVDKVEPSLIFGATRQVMFDVFRSVRILNSKNNRYDFTPI
jgi:MoaA/NifB/PqqE/SkfB family radical SAM enzyme